MNEIERAIRFYESSPDGQYDELAAEALRQMLARTPDFRLPVADQNLNHRMTATEVVASMSGPEIAQTIKNHNALFRKVQEIYLREPKKP
jgi:hypothetical protein